MKKNFNRLISVVCLLALLILLVPAGALADGAASFSNVVVCVRFADDTATDAFNYTYTSVGDWTYNNWDLITKMYNGNGGGGTPDTSFKAYMTAISDGKLSVTNYMPQQSLDGNSVSVYTMKKPKSGYSSDTSIVTEVIEAMDSGAIPANFTLNKPDYRESKVLDNLTIIVQSMAPADRGSPLYAHKSNYSDPSKTAKGYSVGSYNIFTTSLLVKMPDADNSPTDKQGVIAHEFIHSLGIYDLYRYSGNGNPVGIWDIMATSGYKLQYPLGYTRHSLGYIGMTEASTAGRYTLDMVQKAGGNRLLRVASPISQNEFFCIEYRVKDNTSDPTKIGFDANIPGTGLVVYRVNTAVTSHANSAGEDYIYVFRKDATSTSGATESLENSAIGPGNALTSYGSTDLSADYTKNTIFYQDGSNSGISITNVAPSSDGESISFDLSFADYSSLSLWDSVPLGFSGEEGSEISLASSGSDIYMAYTAGGSTLIKKYNGTALSSVGSISGLSTPSLAVSAGGALYIGGMDDSGHPASYRYNGSAWVAADSTPNYAGSGGYKLFAYGQKMYGCYIEADSPNRLHIRNVDDKTSVSSSLTGAAFSAPAAAVAGNDIYIAVADVFASGEAKKSALYRLAGGVGELQRVGTLPITGASHSIHASDGAVHGVLGGSAMPLVGFSYDGKSLSSKDLVSAGITSGALAAECCGKEYIAYLTGESLGVYTNGDSGLERLGAEVTKACGDYSMAATDNRIYIAAATSSGSLLLKYKQLSAPPPPPPQPSYSIRLTPPAGYNEAVIYVDGISFAATKSGGDYIADSLPTTAKTATMYKYNASGVPIGMYVWRLSYSGNAFTATPVPQFADLLSYHGFSIRVVAPAGIRIKSGISAATRAALTSSGGLAGYTLVEYGTVAMNYANISSKPMIKGGAGTKSGAAYWYSGGTLNDKIFETVDGRHRFTSVLVGIPEANYRTQFAFRSYIILKAGDGSTITLYGAIVHRSIYEIALAVNAKGEFKNNPKADAFVKGIIAASERG